MHTKMLSPSSLQIVRNGLPIYDSAQAGHIETSSSAGHLAVLNVCVKLIAVLHNIRCYWLEHGVNNEKYKYFIMLWHAFKK